LKNYSIESIGNIGLPQILQYEDISSMSKSIEIRSPFLDYRLIEFAFSIPEDYKIRNGYSKYIIRKNASLLSNNIAFNTKKIGFESPDSIILSSKKLNPFIETVLNSNVLNNSNIFNKQNLSKNLENITSKNFPVLWRYICFIRWFELNNLNF
jgi:asparagine synthase (glutamine-hydrolysing)